MDWSQGEKFMPSDKGVEVSPSRTTKASSLWGLFYFQAQESAIKPAFPKRNSKKVSISPSEIW